MPDLQKKNIIVGASQVWISEEDSTTWTDAPLLPAGTAGTSIAVALDASAEWRSVGFTQEGLEFSYEPDWADIEVDQLLDSAKIFKQGQRVMINTTFAEATLENLVVAWGQQGSTHDTTDADGEETLGISAGELGDEPVERALVAVGPAPRTDANLRRERVYYGRRILSADASSHSQRRAEATVFPVSFRALPDAAFPGAQYGFIRDRLLEIPTP